MDAIMDSPYLGPGAAVFLGFQHGEKHLQVFLILQAHALLLLVLVIARMQYLSEPLAHALPTSLRLGGLYLLGLYTSLLTYRTFFNPLNVFPGPFSARLSKFSHVIQNSRLMGHKELLEKHRRLGQFVRLGPNEISVTDPNAVAVISRADSKCSKAPWYANDTPLISMHTTRDRQQHDRRRKVWSPAFSPSALRGYETRVQKYNDQLIDGLAEGKFGKEVNVSEVFNWYSFDAMGDLAFGRSFDCLTSAETHWAIKLLNEGMKPAGLGMPTWFFQFIISIPGAATDYWRFINFCSDQLAKRMGEQATRNQKLADTGKADQGSVSTDRDITYTLIEHYQKMSPADQRKALPMLQGDSRLIIVAGSDTTAATLVYMFYWLAQDPKLVASLRDEAEQCRGDDGKFSHQKLIDAELLNGVIYESLRLNPPVPSGVFRQTPKEGVHVGDVFVPGGTTIQMPWYVMARGELSSFF
ncbi:uncharacterized protein HMPREF1541_02275 [Cyphellophora europaea CBS 101466]|uniref:Uncharacterized protein n=1 Tax=Cyphellophora europaea (strain CBS 101466) TaxID=1220924 RepID=W2S347_CYPE1|nr:uncharacterized protein HMPREF1541_02275 [Cyphellophora europaea CBS 101466]ETN43117.1 hypothetical protein HMPREF1541_02275 [Cyphellophora europaea CBS 101466]